MESGNAIGVPASVHKKRGLGPEYYDAQGRNSVAAFKLAFRIMFAAVAVGTLWNEWNANNQQVAQNNPPAVAPQRPAEQKPADIAFDPAEEEASELTEDSEAPSPESLALEHELAAP